MYKKILNLTNPLLLTTLLAASFVIGCNGKSRCETNADCKGESSFSVCLPDEEGTNACQPIEQKENGGSCKKDYECTGGKCVIDEGKSEGICKQTCQTKDNCMAASGDSSRARCLITLKQNTSGYCVQSCEKDADCGDKKACRGKQGSMYCDQAPEGKIEQTQLQGGKCYSRKDFKEITPQQRIDYDVDRAYGAGFDYFVDTEFDLPEGVKSFFLYGVYGKKGFKRHVPDLTPVEFVNSANKKISWGPLGVSVGTLPGLVASEVGIMLPMTSNGDDTKDFVKPGKLKVKFAYRHAEDDDFRLCVLSRTTTSPGDTLDINLYIVGVKDKLGKELTSETVKNNKEIAKTIAKVKEVYKKANLKIGSVRYIFPPENIVERYKVLRYLDPKQFYTDVIGPLVATSKPPTSYPEDLLSINLFLVNAIYEGGAADVESNILGQSSNIPGAPGIHGSKISGVVFSALPISGRVEPQIDYVTGNTVDGTSLLGETIAHEMGHFLGLFHTTELRLDSQGNVKSDPLDDTKVCDKAVLQGSLSNFTRCNDYHNLMFPVSGVGHDQITEEQKTVMTHHPLFK